MRLIVERNLVNLKRMRNIATYNLGLAAFLVVMEFVLARLTRLDMSRFLAWIAFLRWQEHGIALCQSELLRGTVGRI